MERLQLPGLSGPALLDSGVRLLGVSFTLAAIILAGRWLTEISAPRPVAELRSTPMSRPDSSGKTISRLFGTGATQATALDGLFLTGVFSGSRGGGFATLHTRSGDVPVFRGDEIAPGVIVKQIESDRVILLYSGIRKELRLRNVNAPLASPVAQTAPAGPRQPAQAEDQ